MAKINDVRGAGDDQVVEVVAPVLNVDLVLAVEPGDGPCGFGVVDRSDLDVILQVDWLLGARASGPTFGLYSIATAGAMNVASAVAMDQW